MNARSLSRYRKAWSSALIFFVLASPATLPGQTGTRHHPSAGAVCPTPGPAATATPPPEQEVAVPGRSQDNKTASGTAAVSAIDPSEIENFDTLPRPIQQILSAALDLTRKNLTYTYGSDSPSSGGMDCSGTISYLLKSQGFSDVPRQASEQYSWVRRKSRVYPVLSKRQDNAELNELRPGDLMFWTGTYNVDRDPPVTHTMIYLGRRRKDGHRLMFGASDGRPYDGQKRNGVSVFDFRMPGSREGETSSAPAPDHAPDFAGYGPIPGVADLNDAASRQTAAAHEPVSGNGDSAKTENTSKAEAKPSPTPRRKRR